MSSHTKSFSYEEAGLSYTVTVYENSDGTFSADITVIEGAMDINAVYYGDDDFSGKSDSLGGPLNMNGARLEGEAVQWDSSQKLSDPGLGPEGEEKDTFLLEGDTYTVDLTDLSSLDDLQVFGVRATSTTTEEGSIKGVSTPTDDPEEPEEPLLQKVFFGNDFDDPGEADGTFILDEEPDPNTFNVPSLPEGTEPTFENYVSYFETELGGDVTSIEAVIFYGLTSEGDPEELFRILAPEGGFADSEELIEAYDDVISEVAPSSSDGSADLIAALTVPEIDPGSGTGPEHDDDSLEEVELL